VSRDSNESGETIVTRLLSSGLHSEVGTAGAGTGTGAGANSC